MYGRDKAQYHNIFPTRHAEVSPEGLPVATARLTDFARKTVAHPADQILATRPACPVVINDKRLVLDQNKSVQRRLRV